MKVIGVAFVFIFILCGGCSSSNNDIPADNGLTVEIKPLGDMGYGADLFSCYKDCYSKLVSKNDTGYIINNDDDYTLYKIRSNCLEIINWPTVDFTRNTLLAGMIFTSTSCCSIIKIDFSKDISFTKYSFVITLQQGTAQSPGAVFYWALTAKLSADVPVGFTHKYYSIQ